MQLQQLLNVLNFKVQIYHSLRKVVDAKTREECAIWSCVVAVVVVVIVFVRFSLGVSLTALLQQAVGRMLFWGQQGVSPDIQTAVRHYERGAIRLEDPVSMYDYAIVLLQVRVYNTESEERADCRPVFKQ